MITEPTARWLLTAVFSAAGLGAALPRHGPAGAAGAAGRVPAMSCLLMCAALTAMTWWSEPAAAAWPQAAVFGCAALWSGRAVLADSGRARHAGLPAVLHALMAGAMIWMLTAMPAAAAMPPAGPRRGAMMPMSRAATPALVLAVSILLAAACAAACIPWLARAIGPGPRVKDPASVAQAAMSAAMAAMLLATL
ncbi:MAG TPA: DUF5134 domain-containing protein [Streptosporangiaceae bacterium]|nr:DUF5134 domain-containing protein [Streptosporangiaceae bacterium]